MATSSWQILLLELSGRWAGSGSTGPTHANFDVNLVKRIRISEGKEFEIRLDAVNVMNNPSWAFVAGATDINNVSFGKLTAADPTGGVSQSQNTVANRRFTFNARLTF